MSDLSQIKFDANGLVPCVTQDHRTGAVLTHAWMSEESLRRTIATGQVWFYSRSRAELWQKGATSGNLQDVIELRYDCDGDALLALVRTHGPACHTGEQTCFYRALNGRSEARSFEAPGALQAMINDRRESAPEGSYTAKLLSDPTFAGEKVQEEAEEIVRAVREESDERIAEEAADLIYHFAVAMAGRGVSLADAFDVLNARAAGR